MKLIYLILINFNLNIMNSYILMSIYACRSVVGIAFCANPHPFLPSWGPLAQQDYAGVIVAGLGHCWISACCPLMYSFH